MFLSSLHSLTEGQALAQLLTHLPLLHPGNTDARKEYMKLLPKVLLSSSEAQKYLDLCRQLLSLALVHPAFPQEDREALTFWLSKLDGKHNATAKKITSLPVMSPLSPSVSSHDDTATSSTTVVPSVLKVHQIKSEDSSCSLGNGDLPIYGYIGTVSNGFDTHDLTSTDRTSTAQSPLPSHNYMHTLEEVVDKHLTLPPNLSAHDALQLGKARQKSTTLPARTAHYNSMMMMGDDISCIEWNHGMKGWCFPLDVYT